MDAETRQALTQLAGRLEVVRGDMELRVQWMATRHEHEWKDAAAWRTQWTAELDALIIEVKLLKRTLEQHIMSERQETQSERLYRKVNDLTAAFAEVLFEMLPDDRQPLKQRFTTSLGDLLAEVIGGATTMAAGVVVGIDKRVSVLEKQVGDDAAG